MQIKQELQQIAEMLNEIIAANLARHEISQTLRGVRGDAFLDCRDANGKMNLAKFRALRGDAAIDVAALNEKARELDEKRADMRRSFRAFVGSTLVWALSQELRAVCSEFLRDGIDTGILLDDCDKPRADLWIKLQKASNGKGTGKIVPNL